MPQDPRDSITPAESAPFAAYCSANLKPARRPGWSILCSLLIHALAFTATLFIPPTQRRIEEYIPFPRIVRNQSGPARMVVFLPAVGGGGPGKQGKQKSSPNESPSSGSAKKGFSYPGPQRIRSDSSSPTSRSQTLLQPGREDLPVLSEPVDLPNIVSIKDSVPSLQPQLPDPAADFVAPADFVKPTLPSSSEDDTGETPQPEQEELPSVVKPAPQLPKPISIKRDPLALQPGLTAKLPEPLRRVKEQEPTEPQQPEKAEVAVVKPPRDLPKPVALAEGEVPLPPGLPEPAAGPPDSPEPKSPAKPPDQAATEQPEVKSEELPIQEVPEDPPEPSAETEEAVDSRVPTPVPDVRLADAAEPKEQPFEEQLGGSIDRPIESVARPAPTLSDASRKVGPTSLPLPSTDLGNLIALTPAPKPITDSIEIPAAESRGQFEISPEGTGASGTEPGSPSGQADRNSASTGEAGGSPASAVTISFGSGNGEGSGSGGGQGTGSQAGSGSGTGMGPGTGAGSGPGAGPFAGITVVGGVGEAKSSSSGQPFAGISVVGGIPGEGSASGTAPADQPFAGITTVGGIGDSDASADSAANEPTARPLETKYGVVVLSTQDSGGGLPNVGVFSDERIHTVYLDMRQEETDNEPVWTIEFAEPWESENEAMTVRKPDKSDFVKPSPAVKERPDLPAELVRRYSGRMILVYALIDAEGRFDQISVKESPDPLFDQPVLEALSKWVFRPGALNGRPVAVKALLGIPVW